MVGWAGKLRTQILLLSAGALSAVPTFAQDGAATDWSGWTLKVLVSRLIEKIGNILIPLALAILFFMFIFNIALFILAINKGEKDIAGLAKKRLAYPVLALFVLFSIWGLVTILQILFRG